MDWKDTSDTITKFSETIVESRRRNGHDSANAYAYALGYIESYFKTLVLNLPEDQREHYVGRIKNEIETFKSN